MKSYVKGLFTSTTHGKNSNTNFSSNSYDTDRADSSSSDSDKGTSVSICYNDMKLEDFRDLLHLCNGSNSQLFKGKLNFICNNSHFD